MSTSINSCNCDADVSETDLLTRLDEIINAHCQTPGALIPILQMTQTLFKYLPDIAIKRICHGLNKSYSEVAGVISFYSFFSTRPRGKYLIRVCLGTACYVRGGTRVLEAIEKKLGIQVGETTPDHLFSLEIARCFGACGLAPVITINDEVHHRVNPNKLEQILSHYRDQDAIVVKNR